MKKDKTGLGRQEQGMYVCYISGLHGGPLGWMTVCEGLNGEAVSCMNIRGFPCTKALKQEDSWHLGRTARRIRRLDGRSKGTVGGLVRDRRGRQQATWVWQSFPTASGFVLFPWVLIRSVCFLRKKTFLLYLSRFGWVLGSWNKINFHGNIFLIAFCHFYCPMTSWVFPIT